MERIVVGVDDSATAAKAAGRAADLAAKVNADLHVVTAFGNARAEGVLAARADEWLTALQQEAEETVSRVAETLRADAPDVRITSAAVHGKPHTVLLSEATRRQADLIVVGNRRMQGAQRVLGSVASAVAHRAPCDIYIVHTVG
jgi:nucleotide-binding universal stress UspA family protein